MTKRKKTKRKKPKPLVSKMVCESCHGIHTNAVCPTVLSQNGVRMVQDHQLYAEFCEAADTIVRIADFLNGSCSDLCYSVDEADWFNAAARTVQKLREEVDRWRVTGKMKAPLEEE